MAMNANSTHWAFLWYVKNNPFKALGGMTNDDLDNMSALFIDANAELSTTATYTDAEFPGGITAAATQAAIDQANFPEKHKSA